MNESGGTALRMRPVSLIGEGARGEVFVGIDEVLHRRVIVRKLSTQRFASELQRHKLIREAQILAGLDHPNILHIHDYTEENGYDIFTVEFAPGDKLSEVLEEETLDFARKLSIATAVASALVVAHRHGIVHGAICPDNVLLTQKGEIKLTDFASTTTRVNGPRAESRWRSPEQKRGDTVTITSDIYSFGLLLRELFGNRDRDVRALVTAMIREVPSERPIARETLARLNRLAQRKGRRIRGAAIAAGVLILIAGTFKYTADLRRERALAVAARADAEARREQANALIGFVVLNIGPKLRFAGRLDIMDATSEKALTYFASMTPEEISPAEMRINIEALEQLVQSHIAQGDYATASAILRKAIEAGDAVQRRAPDDLPLRSAIGTVHAILSNTLSKEGDIDGALAEARLYLGVAASLARHDRHNVEYMRNEAAAHGILGLLYDRKEEIPASLRELELAIAGKRHVLTMDDTPDAHLDLAVPIHKAGLALFKLGRFDEMRTTLEPERARLDARLASAPSQWPMRELLAIFDDDLVTLGIATGDLDSARSYCASHLARSRKLVGFDAANMDWQRQIVVAQRSAGTVARMSGDVATAVRDHEVAVDLLTRTFANGKETRVLVREMSVNRIELARSLLAAKQPERAAAQVKLAIEALQPLRNELASQRFLAEALLVKGEIQETRGDKAGADAAWNDGLRELAPLGAISPDPRVADTHVRLLLHLARNASAQPFIEELRAIGYRNPEYEALRRSKGAFIEL